MFICSKIKYGSRTFVEVSKSDIANEYEQTRRRKRKPSERFINRNMNFCNMILFHMQKKRIFYKRHIQITISKK